MLSSAGLAESPVTFRPRPLSTGRFSKLPVQQSPYWKCNTIAASPKHIVALLGMTFGDRAQEIRESASKAVIAGIVSGDGNGVLHDALLNDAACEELLSLIANQSERTAQHGADSRRPHGCIPQRGWWTEPIRTTVRRSSAEQSNSSILFGDRFI